MYIYYIKSFTVNVKVYKQLKRNLLFLFRIASKPSESSSRCDLSRLIRATDHLIGEFHKSKVLPIARTLLVLKAKNINW